MSEEFVDVLFTADGVPWKVKRGSHVWQVAVRPSCHFERVNWWEDLSFSIRKGAADRIDFAVWRVQVRLGTNPRSDLVTWDLIEHPRAVSWSIREVA